MIEHQRASVNGIFAYRLSGWKNSAVIRTVLFVMLGILLYAALFGKWVPPTYDIRVGMRSEKTIYAPKQIENAIETQKAKEEAAKRVQPIYTLLPMRNDRLVEMMFEKLRQINADEQLSQSDKVNVYRNVFPALYRDYTEQLYRTISSNPEYNEGLLNEVKAALDNQLYRIPEEVYFKFPRLTKEDLADMEPVTKEIVSRLMTDQITDAQTARARVAELVNSSPLTKSTTRELVQEIARFALTPNKFLNQQATDEARAKAREETKPVFINKGDILVAEGEIITEEIYQRMEMADLLKDEVNYWPQLGLAIVSIMMTVTVYMFVRQSRSAIRQNNAQLLMLVLIYTLNMIGIKIIALGQNLEYPHIGFLAPVAMGIMLIATLIETQLAFVSAILFSVLASVIFNMDSDSLFDYRYGFVAAVVGIASIFAIQRANQRSSILKAGVIVSLFGALAVVSLVMLDNDAYTRNELLFSVSFIIASGILTAVLVIGLMPFFEVVFGILSPVRLVELSNPNHPLLRKLLTETPGTYHHSVMVGNLAEAAAESIGANGLLCRVGSFYHDVGKTKRPSYFIENQNNIENPHDKIDPHLSKSIIIAHVRDGVDMLKEHKIPKPICDIAEQHHGTTLLKYFYRKALQQQKEGEEPIAEEEYRYPGPKAQSKEAAIVGIADGVEAAVRSLRNPTIEQIDSTVRKIIKDRLDDGQFDECDMTLKELDTIAKTLNKTLLGIFHSRIEYPSDLPEKNAEQRTKEEA